MSLDDLLRRPEGKTLEFKREVHAPERLLQTVVAFANTAGGAVVIGVEDGTGRVVGVADPLALEERLASLITDSVAPRVLPDIEHHTLRRRAVLVVRVHPGASRPYHLLRQGVDRGTYVRVGSTNRRADDAMRAELGRFTRLEAFDERPLPALDSEAVDFRVASESFAPVRRLRRADLETLRLVVRYERRLVPTVGGLLLFGGQREQHFPDAWIQAGRFRGTDRATLLDQQACRGPLVSVIEQAVGFVERHAFRGLTVGRLRRTERWATPPVAIREALVNAVAHADYSQTGAPIRVALYDDRIEIENPGLLPFGLTVEDLLRGTSKIRNRVIGRVFHELGLVEQWGSGAQRMQSACIAAGLPAPRFEEIGTRFRVTFRTDPVAKPVLDDTARAIVALAARPQGVATHEVAEAVGLSPRASRTRLAAMVSDGILREVGTSARDPKRRYYAAR